MSTRPVAKPWTPLAAAFYARPTLTVARDLLGRYLVRNLHGHVLAGKIVEVEAYRGADDPASHAFGGHTQRNDVMFWTGGHLYVYFTYGMHYCANVVTGPQGRPGAVLVRAVEPVQGIEFMRQNRPRTKRDLLLTNGPAKLCEALAISRSENGASLTGPTVYLTHGAPTPEHLIGRSARVGIKNGLDKKWRFFERANLWVSKNLDGSHRR